MPEPIVIDKETIKRLLPMSECITVMKDAFRSLASDQCLQPLRSLMWLPDRKGVLGMMPAHAENLQIMGIKVISVFPDNKKLGLSSHQGVVILFDAKNGTPLCMADADEITALRTPATTALATDLLARGDAETLSILGSGTQAMGHIEGILLVRDIKKVTIWSRNDGNAKELAARVLNKHKLDLIIAKDEEEAVRDADIICAVTASSQPIIKGTWIAKGSHINAVGSSTPKARELDTRAIAIAKLFTDCYESIYSEAGDFIIPQQEGVIDKKHVIGEIGEVLIGKKPGRTGPDDITVFKSLGLAIEDIYSVFHVYKKIIK